MIYFSQVACVSAAHTAFDLHPHWTTSQFVENENVFNVLHEHWESFGIYFFIFYRTQKINSVHCMNAKSKMSLEADCHYCKSV